MEAVALESFARGLAWLVAQQGADGGWHSQTYGQLKDGAALTALALDALAHAPPPLLRQYGAAAVRGCLFFREGLEKRSTIAAPDGSLDFPTYAAALWLSATAKIVGVRSSDEDRSRVLIYLLGAQIGTARGFSPDSPSVGGWDFLGPDDAQGITTGTNISVTRYVIEALAGERQRLKASGGRQPSEATDAAIDSARAYVLRCQQPDGGFAFTCEPASLNNKAAYRDEKLAQPRSYGTATCDGVRALVACGLTADAQPVAKALAWLRERPALDAVPGFEGLLPAAGWQRGLLLYYYAALAGVLPLLPPAERATRGAALQSNVVALQKADGRWASDSDRMRENDPLIATPLALVALAQQ